MTGTGAISLKINPDVRNHPKYKDWEKFHMENRHVIRKIVHQIERAKAAGLKAVSVKAIINALRWDHTIETKGQDWKINDAYTGIYTHVIMDTFPEYKLLLTNRKLRAKSK